MTAPDRGLMLTQRAIRRQLTAMPHDLYMVRLIHNQTRRPLPGQRLWTATELLQPANMKFLRIRNREGFDIYIHPYEYDQNAGYILLDLDRADGGVINHMRENGHDPCVVLETSPGHLQAWIHVTASPLEPCIATAIARQLAREYHGDPASADWRHVGRLAGFTNQKPARCTLLGYAPWVKIVHARAVLAPNANALLDSALNRWGPSCRVASSVSEGSLSTSPITVTNRSMAVEIYGNCLRRWRIAERFSSPDWSVLDLWVARYLLSLRLPTTQVEDIIRLGSPQFPRQHGDPVDYLRRTLARAAFPFPPQGGTV
jgi:RepB DNA-primase from phage plasmid